MTFQPKKITAKVKAGDIGGFNPMNSEFVMCSFKVSGKKFRSVPRGYLAIQPAANIVYAGFDYNNDGVINVVNEAFARFGVQINPFEAKTTTEKLADKFSKSRAKGKLIFKRKDFGEVVAFETSFNRDSLFPVAPINNGQLVDRTFTYGALINTLVGAEM